METKGVDVSLKLVINITAYAMSEAAKEGLSREEITATLLSCAAFGAICCGMSAKNFERTARNFYDGCLKQSVLGGKIA